MYTKGMKLKLKWCSSNEAENEVRKKLNMKFLLGYNMKIVILVGTFGREE